MEHYIMRGQTAVRRCQGERQKRGGGQCGQAACAGTDYCWAHDIRGRQWDESVKARFDRHAESGSTVSEFLDEHKAAVRWMAIVRQYMQQTGVR